MLCPIRTTGAVVTAIARIVHVPGRKNSLSKKLVIGMAKTGNGFIRIEITEKTLIRLLRAGQVCAADLRCLDCTSKQCLWRLCLKSCAEGLKNSMVDVTARKNEDSNRTCGLFPGTEDGRYDSENCHGFKKGLTNKSWTDR